MYIWNDISINVHGSNKIFIDKVIKYINAQFDSNHCKNADIDILISENKSDFTEISESARLVRTIQYEEEFISTLSIYNKDNYLWYIYDDIADIFIDGNENRMVVVIKDLPLEFEYYNILIFMFHPLGIF